MKKIQFLKVLDMTEDEQWEWITEGDRVIKFFPDDDMFFGDPQKYLADLAFRLRDEAVFEYFVEAAIIICQKIISLFPDEKFEARRIVMEWFAVRAKPIHWIVAALIAKTLARN